MKTNEKETNVEYSSSKTLEFFKNPINEKF